MRKGRTMKNYVRPIIGLFILVALPGFLISGCVTIEYVDQQVTRLEGMIDDNSSNIASANARIDALEGRVNDVEASVRDFKNQRVVRRVVLEEEVLFSFDQWTLTDAAKGVLDTLASDVARQGYDWITIAGHADAKGSVGYNRTLGLRRAQSVAAYLGGTAGLDRHKIIMSSYGEEIPTFSNDTSEGRTKNRRVEIVVYRASLSSAGAMTSLATPPAR